ncbi:hypothetical protein [Clostridium sp. JS66]|uniref:hypothetical protein n=1 Tax=Clostridium sp. JS66 TaxID=3064705 RepID=UPI00298E72EF|nr:hypothetical protein [Clostridium sp. JS66]WPC42809.1 hypothetical protein Q6H37_04890 [Clostridium sp. JS66]
MLEKISSVNKVDINGFRFIKEDITFDFLIANKLLKTELSDVDEYGLELFASLQFVNQVKDNDISNLETMLKCIGGACGIKICQEEYDIFIADEILESIYLGRDDKIYYLTNSGIIYSYIQETHTLDKNVSLN